MIWLSRGLHDIETSKWIVTILIDSILLVQSLLNYCEFSRSCGLTRLLLLRASEDTLDSGPDRAFDRIYNFLRLFVIVVNHV